MDFWHPWYRLSVLVKVMTAVASWLTVFALFKAIPAALTLPGLAKINQRLTEEMAGRDATREALRKSEERLRLATDAAGLGIWQWEVETDITTWENDWPYQILGIDPQSPPVNSAAFGRDFVHPEDRPMFMQAVADAATNKTHFFFRGRMVRPDGELRWVEFQGKRLHREMGKPQALIGTTRDITDRMIDEEALQKAHDHLENVLDSITDGLAVLNKEWR